MSGQAAPLTFLFTDIVGSTALWQRHGETMQAALEIHDRLITSAVSRRGGMIFAGGGDGFGVVFSDPSVAVAAAVAAQAEIAELAVGTDPLRVRMGLHTGVAQSRNDDYFGLAVNRAARVSSAANGGQVLVTAATAELIDGAIELRELGEYRLADLLEPVALFQAGPGDFPPVRALDPSNHNLPVRFTSLVGRVALIESVAHAVLDKRLVTLVGPGGVGKTTVALEVGAELSTKIERGVWLVELDDLQQEELIEERVAAVLGLAPVEGWHRTAARRDHLVVLDNAEHLISGVADTVAGLLRAGPQIRFLVTSREPLGIPGELVVEIGPLEAGGEATSLFLDRAPGLDPEAPGVTALVEMTDGLPLAIELVAGHASRMPVEDLVASLREHGLGSLTARGVGRRHASSRAAVAWSYGLLNPIEQEAFESLAVFTQDFSQEAAVAVTLSSPLTFRSLVEKSLVQRSGDRYRLLETIKQFAEDRLKLDDAWDEASRNHAEYVADHVADLAERLPPRPGEDWLAELAVSLTDVIAAFSFAVEATDLDLLLRLCRVLPGPFGAERSLIGALLDTLEPAVPILIDGLPGTRWELYRHAWCEDIGGREPKALEKAQLLRQVASQVGDSYLAAASTFTILSAQIDDPNLSIRELRLLSDEVMRYRGDSDWWEQSTLLAYQGRHLRALGELGEAERILRKALSLPVRTEFNRLIHLTDLAKTLSLAGQHRESLEIWQDIARSAELEPFLRYEVLQETAHEHIALGEPDTALELIQQMVEEDMREHQPTAAAFCAVADYHREIGDHRAATWFLSKMLDGNPPRHPIHHRIVAEAREHLSDEFETEWTRGATMDIYALYALLQEQ